MNLTRRRLLAAATVAALCVHSSGYPASAFEMTSRARRLADFYDNLHVEDLWIAGQHVDWETGNPDGRPETLPGRHTHCSAFVAAAAKRLGIYVLRPPEHGQVLLANAQNEWLATAGPAEGWRAVKDALSAQISANAGLFVLASYHNHRDDRPGHIAIVRPSRKSARAVDEEGPDVIQAGSQNFTEVSLREGFEGHPHAWEDGEIDYYVHDIPSASLSATR